MKRRFRSGGLAAWSIRRPVGVTMLALTVVVLGLLSLQRLGVDLLPHLIYPEIRVRILDPGVPATIMEDTVTRQLEEQLAITEGATDVQSTTREGRTQVNLNFPYGTDIDIALRDASTRLDRAKRFLPDTIDPPVIFKRDPSQLPVLEFVVSSSAMQPVRLRDWVDYEFSKWFLNVPGVAAAEVAGAPLREIQVIVDQDRLTGFGLTLADLEQTLQRENIEAPGGRLMTGGREFSTKSAGRLQRLSDIQNLPLRRVPVNGAEQVVRLRDVARVIDHHEDDLLRVRLNGTPGVKLTIQRQPEANTVEVVDAVMAQLNWLEAQQLLPGHITISRVGDQSIYVRHSLRNASLAALSGALLAMLVVYLFLGSLRRTLIIGLAIPLAILVTFTLMDAGGLTLNIMTLGGLALGVGMLVDNTIVMMENISRHQQLGEGTLDAPTNAAAEVNSAIVAATSTNLAAVLPFLFVTGLVGLLFRELIYTLSAAIVGSLLVALTLVPAYSARVHESGQGRLRNTVDRVIAWLGAHYGRFVARFIVRRPWLPLLVFVPLLLVCLQVFTGSKQIFLPPMDEGRVSVSLVGDAGMQLEELEHAVGRLEKLFRAQPEVGTVFTIAGGRIFGRSEYQSSNRSTLYVQLVPVDQRAVATEAWVKRMHKAIGELGLAGLRVRMRVRGVRGVRTSAGDDDISLRVQGPDIAELARIGEHIVTRLDGVEGVRNLNHTYEETREELAVRIDRDRAADLGVSSDDINRALRIALDGLVVTDFLEGDRSYKVRLRLPRVDVTSADALGNVPVALRQGVPVRLRNVSTIELVPAPSEIMRDRQRRIVEISASLDQDASIVEVGRVIDERLADLELPAGYTLYDQGSLKSLQEGRRLGWQLLALAIFLVFVVMAVQYESLRNPVVILLGVPFTVIGIAAGLWITAMPLSMPIWLGLIMLAGIVVNNAIVLVEQIEIERERGVELDQAIATAARLRLRPILMTTLTTVVGMSPLALGIGEGAEMLQPLAVAIVWGLSFSMLVTLLLIPALYRLMHVHLARRRPALDTQGRPPAS